jgi:hypothetical protein
MATRLQTRPHSKSASDKSVAPSSPSSLSTDLSTSAIVAQTLTAGVELKYCSHCQQYLPITEFAIQRWTRHPQCKAAQREYNKKHYQGRRDEAIANNAVRKLVRKAERYALIDEAPHPRNCEACAKPLPRKAEITSRTRPFGVLRSGPSVNAMASATRPLAMIEDALASPDLRWICQGCICNNVSPY